MSKLILPASMTPKKAEDHEIFDTLLTEKIDTRGDKTELLEWWHAGIGDFIGLMGMNPPEELLQGKTPNEKLQHNHHCVIKALRRLATEHETLLKNIS